MTVVNELVRWLRVLPRTIGDGVAASRGLLLWGHVYPRTIGMAELRQMRSRR